MKFRPCIDIHNGKVKQIVGGSLSDKNNFAEDNFISEYSGGYYGKLYKEYGLDGGHIIILNPAGSEFYNADIKEAYSALAAFEGGLQIGGGINDENAADFLNRGASHVIITSFVFKNGVINFDNLKRLVKKIGKEHLVLDLSARKRQDEYFIVTDRWQKFTDVKLDLQTMDMLKGYCDEFLVHAVDSEGKAHGIENGVAELLGAAEGITSTYAGGISSFDDLHKLEKVGKGKVDFTVGSALDIFGGNLNFEDVIKFSQKNM